MKEWDFKHIITFALLLLAIIPQPASAMDTTEKKSGSKAHKTIKADRGKWYRALVPKSIVAQYAGNIGAVSAGVEWSYGKNGRWGTSILFGYIPRYYSSCSKATTTLKQRFTPYTIDINEHIVFKPFECGLFLNTIINGEFWVKEPSKYPDGYYGFATRVRTNIYIGQRLDLLLPKKYSEQIKSLSLYYELSTCDFHIVSYATNSKYLDLGDLFCLGLGMKVNF